MAKIAARTMVVMLPMAVWLWGCAAGPEYYEPQAACPGQCGAVAQQQVVTTPTPVVATLANPTFFPVADPQIAWEQIADTIDDYFRIEHEEQPRILNDMATEGTLTTVPEVSPTIFEPWRHDTGDHDQRWENTLQTMRRRAVVRVRPVQGGQEVEVQVFKELEDNKHPDHATAGAATFRYDATLSGVENPVTGESTTLGWIPQGRDTSLEQNILANLLSRSGGTAAAPCGPVTR
jgi:hypothetical protein